jgi:hypothetical protein
MTGNCYGSIPAVSLWWYWIWASRWIEAKYAPKLSHMNALLGRPNTLTRCHEIICARVVNMLPRFDFELCGTEHCSFFPAIEESSRRRGWAPVEDSFSYASRRQKTAQHPVCRAHQVQGRKSTAIALDCVQKPCGFVTDSASTPSTEYCR